MQFQNPTDSCLKQTFYRFGNVCSVLERKVLGSFLDPSNRTQRDPFEPLQLILRNCVAGSQCYDHNSFHASVQYENIIDLIKTYQEKENSPTKTICNSLCLAWFCQVCKYDTWPLWHTIEICTSKGRIKTCNACFNSCGFLILFYIQMLKNYYSRFANKTS